MQIENELIEQVDQADQPEVKQVVIPTFVMSNSKKIREWLLIVEYEVGDKWINLQTVSVPKSKVSEVRARRLLDDMVTKYVNAKPGQAFRGLLASQVYGVAIRAKDEVQD